MMLSITGYRYNTNSSDRPIQLAERKENNEGDALIGSKIMISYLFFMNQ